MSPLQIAEAILTHEPVDPRVCKGLENEILAAMIGIVDRDKHGEDAVDHVTVQLRWALGQTRQKVITNQQSQEWVWEWNGPRPNIDSVDSALRWIGDDVWMYSSAVNGTTVGIGEKMFPSGYLRLARALWAARVKVIQQTQGQA